MKKSLLALAIALVPSLAWAQGAVLQNGPVIKFDLPGWVQDKTIMSGGKMLTDNFRGFNPSHFFDNHGPGVCTEDALTNGPYHQFCFGHDAAGNALVTVDSYNGAAAQTFITRVNGVNIPIPGSINGMPFTADRTSLASLASSFSSAVLRLEYAVSLGGPSVVYRSSGSACSLNGGAGDGGSQVPTSDGKCWLADLSGIRPTPQIWGARGDGTNDDTAPIQAAVTSGSDVYLPSGTYKVTDMITLPTGRTIRGAGRTKSIIQVPNTFNMGALGVVRMGTAEPGATMLDIGIDFIQPDVTTKGSMTAYPAAIYAVGSARFILDRVRISGGWDGINATGNIGGAYLGFLEIGAINKGIQFGSALDFVHGGHWHIWPFGFSSVNRLTAWTAAGVTGLTTTQMDGLEIGSISAFQAKLDFLSSVATLPIQIGRVSLDGNGSTLTDTNFSLLIGSLYTTKDTGSVTPSITASTGSNIVIEALDQSVASSSDDIVVNAAGARLVINSGDSIQNSLGYSAFAVSNGILDLHNIRMKHAPSGTRTVATVSQTASGALRMSGNQWSGKNAVVGPALSVVADHVLNFIAGNDFVDWPVTFPAAFVQGEYGPNKITSFTAVPTVGFATNGDFVPSYTSRDTAYKILGDGTIWFETFVQFDTNAFTTASGAFQIATGLPAQPVRDITIALGDLSNVTFGTGVLAGAVINSFKNVLLRELTSNAPVGNMTTTHILPSKTGILVRVAGTYRFR